MRKTIPIQAAKDLGLSTGFQEIVIFGYDPETGQQHVTTYGISEEQSQDAANAGNFLKKALSWPEESCHAKPARAELLDSGELSIDEVEFLVSTGELPGSAIDARDLGNVPDVDPDPYIPMDQVTG